MKKSICDNISANLFIRLITYVFSFLSVAYATRILQPEAFGRISFVSSFIGYFALLANLGIPIYGMRLCAERKNDKKDLSKVSSELWSISILFSGISLLLLLVLLYTIPRLGQDRTLFLIYGTGILLQAFGFEWLFKGLEQFKFLAICHLSSKVISFLCMILFVHSREQLPLYAMLSVLTAHGSNLICYFFARKKIELTFKLNIYHIKPLLIFFLMACAGTIYSSLDLTMLGFMKSDIETGLYSVAAKGNSVLTSVSSVIWMSTLPQATRLWKEGKKERFELFAGKTLFGVLAIQTLVIIVCWIFSRQIVTIIGGESYTGAQDAFRILLFSLIPIGISNILGGQVLIPAKCEKYLLCAQISGAIINFVTNILLIPIWSIEGAAVTTVASEVIVAGVCVYFTKTRLQMNYGLSIRNVEENVKKRLRKAVVILNSKIKRSKLPYYCPCCETYLSRFIKGGYRNWPDKVDLKRYEQTRQDVICHVCGSLPRHRILAMWCYEHKEELEASEILYFAPEPGIMKWMKKHGIICTTADLMAEADLTMDIQDMGIASESYDYIFCNHVLEHVDDYRIALQEVHRVLRKDGKLICSFPMDLSVEVVDEDPSITTNEDRKKRFGQTDHKRIFGMKANEILEEAGFTVWLIRGKDYSEKILPVIGPANYDLDLLFVCQKEE